MVVGIFPPFIEKNKNKTKTAQKNTQIKTNQKKKKTTKNDQTIKQKQKKKNPVENRFNFSWIHNTK